MQSVNRTNRQFKLREMPLCVIVILALCVSAVSACSCTHHQIKAAADEQPPCHSSSHAETVPVVDDRPLFDHVDANCNCFVNTPVAAIVSKSESKKIAAEKIKQSGDVLASPMELVRLELKQETVFYDAADLDYSNHLLTSGPSRAPPRL